jgi:3-oxoacyl-[acyl-carrier-protein] synthase II
MALSACLLALEDAKVSQEAELKHLGIVVGSGYGSTCNTFELEGFGVDDDLLRFSPIQFSNSVQNAAGAHIAAFLKSYGPNLSINQFDLSFPAALATACYWLKEGRTDRVLVGGTDDYSQIMAWHRRQLLASPEAPTYLPPVGEGAVFFVLDRKVEEPSVYGCILEAGLENSEMLHAWSRNAPIIIGADGFSPNEARYDRWPCQGLLAYSPLYGQLPVGTAFDMAIAALILKRNTLFASAQDASDLEGFPDLHREHRPFYGNKICCLKLSQTGGQGYIVLEKMWRCG